MQERVVERAARNGAGGWYLARGDKEYGPLTDRELSLFAEGGNFRTGDLLWTAGLDNWKPAETILGLAPSPLAAARAADAPNGEAVNALVKALTAGAQKPVTKPTLKERAVEEIKKFAAIFVYLWVVFTILLVHEWVVLSENHIGFKFYGLAAINAIVLGKIMLIADHLRFAERLKAKPLIYPIVYKSVLFTTLLFVAYVLEEMLVGLIGGNGLIASVPRIGGGLLGALSVWLIFCIALIPFFAFKEVERVIGPDEFRAMLFGRRRTRR